MIKHSTYTFAGDFELESGKSIPGFQLSYSTFGELNENNDNIIWVCHALTGSSDFLVWWDGLFGKGRIYDPEKYFIICANTLGGCYGSTGPLSTNPATQKPFYHSFPSLTIRDIVKAFDYLRQHLGFSRIHTVIGGSMGGQQALEWAIQSPEVFQHLIQIASNAKHSPWGIAFNETQRAAISQDITWQLSIDQAGLNGMKVARSIALLSYRNYQTYELTQSEDSDEKVDHFKASSYQNYQGEKLSQRFNAYTYWILSKAMDSHNVGRNRGGISPALNLIKSKCLFIGISTDVLFPIEEQALLAKQVKGSTFNVLESKFGHDGFLIEYEQLSNSIYAFYKEVSEPEKIKLDN